MTKRIDGILMVFENTFCVFFSGFDLFEIVIVANVVNADKHEVSTLMNSYPYNFLKSDCASKTRRR